MCCIWRTCGRIFERADGSAAFAPMASFAWEALPTTLANTLLSAVWLFTLILILPRLSVSLREVTSSFGCQLWV